MNVAEAPLEVIGRLGLNMRAAVAVVQTARTFNAQVMIGRGQNQVSAKSVIELIMLGAGQGSRLQLHAEGDDAGAAVTAIQALFRNSLAD